MYNYSHTTSGKTLRAGILGHSGYSGAELLRLLEKHPAVVPVLLDHRRAEGGGDSARPAPAGGGNLPQAQRLPWKPGVIAEQRLDVVFTATPPEVSMEVAPEALRQGARVIDLSGAFRLPSADAYRRWYGAEHTCAELLGEAVYGLPELYRNSIRGARLIANPGCYPTAAICALWPLLRADLADRAAGVVCDAKSGVTGAGKTPSPKTHFVQVSENFSAYAILKHRHVPEMLGSLGLQESEYSFTAHLLPTQRGILATHYLRLKQPASWEQLQQLYRDAYRDAAFIRLYPQGAQPQLQWVNGTNFCDIHCTLGADGQRLVVVSCIDNLVKGAAGQAVQNLNVLFGREETEGLLETPPFVEAGAL